MRKLLLVLVAVLAFPAAAKGTAVKGHFKKDGTYVAPHLRTTPNATKLDNYGTTGNVSPTGKKGTKKP